MGSQRVGHDWVTELNWTDTLLKPLHECACTLSLKHLWFYCSGKYCFRRDPQCFPGYHDGSARICLQGRRHRRGGFDPWVGKMPWRRAWQLTPVFSPGESPGQRSLAGYSPCGHKELDVTERLRTLSDLLELFMYCLTLLLELWMKFLSFYSFILPEWFNEYA